MDHGRCLSIIILFPLLCTLSGATKVDLATNYKLIKTSFSLTKSINFAFSQQQFPSYFTSFSNDFTWMEKSDHLKYEDWEQ